jgi:hypothetical protein
MCCCPLVSAGSLILPFASVINEPVRFFMRRSFMSSTNYPAQENAVVDALPNARPWRWIAYFVLPVNKRKFKQGRLTRPGRKLSKF